MSLGPAPVLALLLGLLHVSLYVLIRGTAGQRLPWLVLAAFLGAWAGDALGARLGIGYILIGDFHLIVASVMAWVGIVGVAIVAILGPQPAPGAAEPTMRTIAVSRSRFPRARAQPEDAPEANEGTPLGDPVGVQADDPDDALEDPA